MTVFNDRNKHKILNNKKKQAKMTESHDKDFKGNNQKINGKKCCTITICITTKMNQN